MSKSPPLAAKPSAPPRHVAIIMDGNGRWAKQHGLPRTAGHEAGSHAIRKALEAAIQRGVEYVTLYAFSSENWNRPPLEVKALMTLLEKFLDSKLREMMKQDVRLLAIGQTERLPVRCREKLARAIAKTADNKKLTMILAISYGSREEILEAAKKLACEAAAGTLDPATITVEDFVDRLDTAGIPDPDLLIRTSGEMRLSNFLLWQLSYTELYVTQKLWPDFDGDDFCAALDEYAHRERRYGL